MSISVRAKSIDLVLSALGTFYSVKLLRYRDLSKLLEEMRQAQSTGVSDADAIALYEAVVQRRPRFILELGAGQSSAVIALGMHDADCHSRFVAIEENPKWVAHHKETIPQRLLPSIELIQRNTAARQVDDA